jgi:hypothetical protein
VRGRIRLACGLAGPAVAVAGTLGDGGLDDLRAGIAARVECIAARIVCGGGGCELRMGALGLLGNAAESRSLKCFWRCSAGGLRAVAIGTTATQIASPEPTRCAILFSPLDVATRFYTVASLASVNSGAGLVICGGPAPVLLALGQVGDEVKQPWYAVGIAAMSVGVMEPTEDCPCASGL